uniref:Retrotransposon Copia-like N-terminal domain-containing protein n=1 Tax=Chenopodium quinoa TaxID=63459 RepID=A0A803LN92_CHEQI
MAGQDKETKNENGYADPLFLANSDNANIPLVNITFNGENFLNWSRSIKLALGSKNKLGFLEGKVSKPKTEDPRYDLWVRNDYMLRGWLCRSMDEKIANSFTYIDSVEKLWNELKERYGETNAPLLYSLKKQFKNLEQENMPVYEYYFKIKQIWDEIQDVEGLPECTCTAMTCQLLKNFLEIQERNKQAEKQRQIIEGQNMSESSAFAVNKMNQGRGA